MLQLAMYSGSGQSAPRGGSKEEQAEMRELRKVCCKCKCERLR
jgi:hypothetical protein